MNLKGLNNKISLSYADSGNDMPGRASIKERVWENGILHAWNDKAKPFVKKSSSSVSNKIKSRGRVNLPTKKIVKWFVIILVISAAGYAGWQYLTTEPQSAQSQPEVAGAKATAEIDRNFNFPLKGDSEEEDINEFIYEIDKVELQDEIVVKGQKATSVRGRTFLIITLKLTNNLDQAIKINTRDYVRLSINGNKEEWLAPEIHNDPVEVQAISTKYTRLGFTINDSDKDLLLRVGEIGGDKQEVEINF